MNRNRVKADDPSTLSHRFFSLEMDLFAISVISCFEVLVGSASHEGWNSPAPAGRCLGTCGELVLHPGLDGHEPLGGLEQVLRRSANALVF